MKKVSVIMPNYNHAPYLRERMDSILAQDYPNIELIILDDASTDDSVALLTEYAQHPAIAHWIPNEHNSGCTFAQWQKGLTLATGEYVWIAESDDVAEPQLITRLVQAIEQNNAVLAFANSVRINQHGQALLCKQDKKWHSNFAMTGDQFVTQYLLAYSHICNASAVLFRREAWEKVDMERVKQYTASGDRLFWAEVALQGNVTYVAATLNRFRQHTQKVSGTAQWEGRNIVQDHAIYSYLKQRLTLTTCDKYYVCGYHWHAMHQKAVSSQGCEKAKKQWSAEPQFGLIAWIYYAIHRIIQKMK